MIWISKLVATPGFSKGAFVDEENVEHVLLIHYEPSANESVCFPKHRPWATPSYHSYWGKLSTILFLAPSLNLLHENSKRQIPEGECLTLTRYNSYDIR